MCSTAWRLWDIRSWRTPLALPMPFSLHPTWNPILILMDIKIRGPLDGIEAATHIRAHQDIPIIYLTAFADESTLQRARA